MKSDDSKKGKPARKPVARRARSSRAKSRRGISPSPAGSLSIQPGDAGFIRMLETLKPHDHICLIYESKEEWRAALVPFISIGLKRGEKCIYFVDTSTADEIRKYLADEGVDVASAEKSGQLSILHETEAYTRKDSFDPDKMIALLISETEKAIAEGYPALRVTGEMTWVLRGHPSSEKFLEYEAKLNRDLFPKYPCLAICQYDRWKFDPEIIRGVIMTHPLLIRGNRIYRNFYYIAPQEFLNEKRTAREVQQWLNNIDREQQIEEKYWTVMEEIEEGYYELDLAGNWTLFNDTFCNSLGYSREELTGMNYRAVTFEEDADTVFKIFEEAYRTGKVAKDLSFRAVCKDGSIRLIEASAFPIRNEEGNIIGFRGIGRDVTERKKAEEALVDEATRRRILIEQSRDGIVVLDEDAKVCEANQRFAEMLGYTPEEVRELHTWDWDVQWTREELLETGRGVDEAGALLETRHRRKDGTVFDVDISVNSAIVGGQKLIFCVSRDVTERKQAEEALRDREARFRYLFEYSQIANALVGLDGKIIDANQAAAELYGYDKSEITGMDLMEFIAPESKAKVAEAFASGLVRGRADPVEVEVATKKGMRTFFFPGGYHMLFEGGKETGFLISAVDVTERKQAEEKMKHLNLVLRAIRNVNQLIARGADRDTLLKGVCKNFVKTRGYHNAWIALLDESGKLVTAAEAGLGEAFLQVIERLKRGELPDCGRKALKKSGVVVIEDPSSVCTDCPLAKNHSGRGGMSIRLEYGGKVYGMMAVSTPLGFLGQKEEDDLFEEVAGDIAFALHSMEQEEERKKAEEGMRHLNLVLRAIRNVNQLIARGADRDSLLKGVCKNFVKTRGYYNAWIALLDESGKLVTAAEAGLGDDFLQMIERLKRGELPDCGWKALKKSGVVALEDPPSVCIDCPLAKNYSGRGGMSVRLKYGDKVYGMMAVSAPLGFLGQKEEDALFEEVAGDIAFALHSMEQEEERKKAEEALRRSEQNFHDSLENSPVGIRILNKDGKTLYSNRALLDIWGYSSIEELEAVPREQRYTPESYDEHRKRVETRKRGEPVPPNYEINIVRSDGQVRHLSASRGELLWNGESQFQVVYQDITERKQAEEALAGEAMRRRILMEQSRDGISILDEDSKVYEANQRFAEMLGYSPEEARELHTWDWDTQWTREELLEMGRGVDEAGAHLETRHRRKDGTVFDVELSVNSVVVAGKKLLFCVSRDVTERKQAEEALRRSEQNFRDSMENSPLGIRVLDKDGKTLYANRALLDMWGYTSVEELEAVPSKQRYTPESYAEYLERSEKRKRGEPVPHSYEASIVRSDGQVRILSASRGELLWNGEKRFQLVYQDITERKQVELALRESEQKHHSLVEDTSVGIASVDLAGNLTFVNRAVCKISGYAESKMLGKPFADFLYPDDLQPVRELFLGAAADQRDSVDMEFRVIDRKGRVIHLHASVTRVKQENETVGFNTMMTDIAERKRMEEELRTSRDYLDRILNSMVEVLMVVDTDYNIIDINRSFLEYYGGKRKDIIGRKCYEVLHQLSKPCSTAQRRCPLRTVLKTGKPFYAEHVYETVEGQKFIFEVSMFPLVDSAGNIEAVVEMQHDVTGSRRAEEEKGQLEQKAQVASRLASVGEMAAGIAHEINNPLTSVIGYSQLLSDRDDIPEDVRMDLKAIDEGAQRVAGIIKRLLTFARQTRPERTLANVNELITNTLDLRAYHLRTNNIKVITELATDLPITTADPAQLQQVFLNIIVNAETAMKLSRGKGKLLIKTEEVNGSMRISFKDNGPGIARKNLARIFDPFFTTREVGQGTGLGLSICHGIIAEHKGRLWVESETGKGATFIVELPIVVESTRFEMVEPAGKEPRKAPRAKILVVDDEPSTLEFLSRLLTNEGHEVDTVSNAAEAFEMVKNKRYSLILLDIKMPGASGIELYGRMQKIAQSFAERVIFITGDIMGTDTEAFLSRTKAPYIIKPFDVNQLKKKIEHFLTGG